MKENYMVCNCKPFSYADIENALHEHKSFGDVPKAFKGVREVKHCSTGCGGCHGQGAPVRHGDRDT